MTAGVLDTSISVVLEAKAWAVASEVTDPEMPMLTLVQLGVLRDIEYTHDGQVDVTITPTYSGCPAMATMRDDLARALQENGFENVNVKIQLQPAWSTDWITESGRRALQAHGISAPGPAPRRGSPIPLNLLPVRRSIACPRCGSMDTAVTSEFGATACKALYRCTHCLEPFEHIKEL